MTPHIWLERRNRRVQIFNNDLNWCSQFLVTSNKTNQALETCLSKLYWKILWMACFLQDEAVLNLGVCRPKNLGATCLGFRDPKWDFRSPVLHGNTQLQPKKGHTTWHFEWIPWHCWRHQSQVVLLRIFFRSCLEWQRWWQRNHGRRRVSQSTTQKGRIRTISRLYREFAFFSCLPDC